MSGHLSPPSPRLDALDREHPDDVVTRARHVERLTLAEEFIDWAGFVRRHLVAMAVTWVLAMTVAALVVFFVLPRKYQSDARFLVRSARQELVVGPGEAPSSSPRGDVTEELLNTEVELLRSRDILGTVVDRLDLGASYRGDGRAPAEARERALRDLSRGLDAGVIRKTNIVQVSYLSPDPRQAAAVVREVADAYLAAHLVMHSSPGTYELYKAQAAAAADQLRQAEEALAGLGRQADLLNLETQKRDALERVNALTAELDATDAAIREQSTRVIAEPTAPDAQAAADVARIAEVHQANLPPRVRTQMRNMPNQYSVERLHTLLVELGNKRTEVLTKFKPEDRIVQEIDQQIADTNRALASAQTLSANEESTDLNPAWQAVEGERLKARLALSGLESKAGALRRELAQHRQSALRLTEAAPAYDTAVRRVTTARANFDLYSRKEEEARIAEALDSSRISNVVLAQAPAVSHVPASPNKRLALGAAAIGAALLALGVAFARELRGVGAGRDDVEVAIFGLSTVDTNLR